MRGLILPPEKTRGADGGTRTRTGFPPRDFKSLASTISPRPREGNSNAVLAAILLSSTGRAGSADNNRALIYCCLILAAGALPGRISPQGSPDDFLSGIFFIAAS